MDPWRQPPNTNGMTPEEVMALGFQNLMDDRDSIANARESLDDLFSTPANLPQQPPSAPAPGPSQQPFMNGWHNAPRGRGVQYQVSSSLSVCLDNPLINDSHMGSTPLQVHKIPATVAAMLDVDLREILAMVAIADVGSGAVVPASEVKLPPAFVALVADQVAIATTINPGSHRISTTASCRVKKIERGSRMAAEDNGESQWRSESFSAHYESEKV
ncbi:MAG: hypothetical protein Q9169_000491 [Polycauliona sp. 2 TL-2023]